MNRSDSPDEQIGAAATGEGSVPMDPLSRSPDKDVQSMTAAVSVRSEPDAVPLKALQAEAVLWFLAAVLGQWMFIVHIAPWQPM